MEDSKKGLFLPIVSVVKKEEKLETRSLKNNNQAQDNTSSNSNIKQEQKFIGENESSMPFEEKIKEPKVQNEPQDCSVKLESELIIDENIQEYKNELIADIKKKIIKLENEYEEIHDSDESKSVFVTEFNNVLTSDTSDEFSNVLASDPLALDAEEETKFIGKEESPIFPLLKKVKKEENTGSVLGQSEVDLFTSKTQRNKRRSRRDNKSLVAENGQSRMDNLQFECNNENDSVYNDLQSNTKYLSSSLHTGITYICDICNKSFSRRNRLYIHMLRHLGMLKKECSVCYKSVNRQHLKTHMSVHDGLRFTCDMCNKSYAKKQYLEKHIKNHLLQFECNTCNENQAFQSCDSEIHNRFRCDVCYKIFSSISAVKIHAKTHKEKEYICEVCNKCFTTKTYVLAHIRQVHSETQYSCKVCFKTYNKPSSLQAHLQLHTDFYVCDICNRTFVKKYCLYSHMLGHLGIRKPIDKVRRYRTVYCSFCSRSFRRSDHLKNHIMTIHRGIRYTCDVCNYSFSTKSDLVRHIKKHLIDFECNICKKPYIDQYSLDLHKKRRHSADFTCNECNKSYGIKKSLIKHIEQKHYNAEFICNECNKSYVNRVSLVRHIEQKHFNAEFICNECNKSYRAKRSLVRHIAQKHFI